MMKTIRKLLGREKFEMPREPIEFTYIRPVIESHISGSWSMGKTPENPAIRIQLDGKIVPPLLEQQLKELANYRGFEVEVSAAGYEPNLAHSNMSYTDCPETNPELTQEDYDRMIKEDKEKGPSCMCSPRAGRKIKMVEIAPQTWECPECGSKIGPPTREVN